MKLRVDCTICGKAPQLHVDKHRHMFESVRIAMDEGASIVLQDVLNERLRAHRKHVMLHGSRETAEAGDGEWLPILLEEVGEVAKALNERASVLHVYAELIQVAAMATAWADAILEDISHNVPTRVIRGVKP